jgi:hypothetical protein
VTFAEYILRKRAMDKACTEEIREGKKKKKKRNELKEQ